MRTSWFARGDFISEWKKQAGIDRIWYGKVLFVGLVPRNKNNALISPTKETGLLSLCRSMWKGRKLSLYGWETAFPAICFMNWRVEPRKTTEYREFHLISRGKYPALSPAYHKYELGERDRDKYPMDGEKAFLHALLSCSLDAQFCSPAHPLLQG